MNKGIKSILIYVFRKKKKQEKKNKKKKKKKSNIGSYKFKELITEKLPTTIVY
jgi:hypothetical protein